MKADRLPRCHDLDQAAAPTLARIRQDHRKAPTRLQPLLAHIEEHLFEQDLDATRLMEALGIRSNTISSRFHAVVALPPYAYIEDCRMEVASRLVRGTKLTIGKIGKLLGYSSIGVFSRAFQRKFHVRPSVYRRRCRAAGSWQGAPRSMDTSSGELEREMSAARVGQATGAVDRQGPVLDYGGCRSREER